MPTVSFWLFVVSNQSCVIKIYPSAKGKPYFCEDMCWIWRQLPQGYFPTFINELQCSSDTRCLKGNDASALVRDARQYNLYTTHRLW